MYKNILYFSLFKVWLITIRHHFRLLTKDIVFMKCELPWYNTLVLTCIYAMLFIHVCLYVCVYVMYICVCMYTYNLISKCQILRESSKYSLEYLKLGFITLFTNIIVISVPIMQLCPKHLVLMKETAK